MSSLCPQLWSTGLSPQLFHMWKEGDSSTPRTKHNKTGELGMVVQV